MAALFDYDKNREASSAAKVRALEALLIKKGVLGSDSVDAVLKHFETVAGPFNGARIVARAWVDPAYKATLAGRYAEGHRRTSISRDDRRRRRAYEGRGQ